MCDATFGQVQTKVLNVSLQREGETETPSPRDTRQGQQRRRQERDKERPVSGDRLAALGPDMVSLLVVVS